MPLSASSVSFLSASLAKVEGLLGELVLVGVA
jgi:hypothetical protein